MTRFDLTVDQTVALAVRQVADLMPEARALIALAANTEAQALLGWLDGAPPAIAPAVYASMAHTVALTLHTTPALAGPDTEFWAAYLKQRSAGRARCGLPAGTPDPVPTPSAAEPAAAPAPKPAEGRPELTEAEVDTLLAAYAEARALLEDLRARPGWAGYKALGEQLTELGVKISGSSLNSLGNGYAERNLRAGIQVLRLKIVVEVIAGLELVTAPDPEPQTLTPTPTEPAITAPTPGGPLEHWATDYGLKPAAPVKGLEEFTRPATVPAPTPTAQQHAITKRERRELAEAMARDGEVNMNTFRKRCGGLSVGTAIELLNGYEFLIRARGPIYLPR